MKIGIDLDNTLIKPINNAVDVAAKNLGIKNYPDICDYWFSSLSEEHRNECMRLFNDPDFMGIKNYRPIEHYSVLNKMMKWKKLGHEIVIITAREEPIHLVTLELVYICFHPIKKVLFCNITESKKQLMIDEKLDVWIDDAPHGVETSCKLGIKTYLIYNERTKKYIPDDLIEGLSVICVEEVSNIKLEGERV